MLGDLFGGVAGLGGAVAYGAVGAFIGALLIKALLKRELRGVIVGGVTALACIMVRLSKDGWGEGALDIASLNDSVEILTLLIAGAIVEKLGSAKEYFDRGEAYYESGEFDRAIADFTEALRLDPNYWAAYFSRACVYQEKGEGDKAIDDLTVAIRINPADSDGYLLRGRGYFAKGDLDKAIDDLTETIRLVPDGIAGYLTRGFSLMGAGRIPEAIRDFEKYLELDPDEQVALMFAKEGGLDHGTTVIRDIIRDLKAGKTGTGDNPASAIEQYALGSKYASGYGGVAENQEMAAHWFAKSADQGYAEALIILGGRYENGRGVGKDKKRAKALYAEAAMQYRKDIERGSAAAMRGLAYCYLMGQGVPKDWGQNSHWNEKSAKQYIKDAERGDADALFELSEIYTCDRFGHSFHQDLDKARNYLFEAAKMGSLPAMMRLGEYYSGSSPSMSSMLHITKDLGKALYWYTKAIEQNTVYNSSSYFASRDLAQDVLDRLKQQNPGEWAEIERKERASREEIERKERAEREKQDRERKELEEREKWKREHPEEWAEMQRKELVERELMEKREIAAREAKERKEQEARAERARKEREEREEKERWERAEREKQERERKEREERAKEIAKKTRSAVALGILSGGALGGALFALFETAIMENGSTVIVLCITSFLVLGLLKRSVMNAKGIKWGCGCIGVPAFILFLGYLFEKAFHMDDATSVIALGVMVGIFVGNDISKMICHKKYGA